MKHLATILAFCGLAAPALADPAEPSLKQLAEIDGDPATFTPDEQRKYALLAQLLGAGAQAPVTETSGAAIPATPMDAPAES